MKKLLIVLSVFILGSCTDNQRARQYGGTEKLKLKPNEILLNIDWDKSNDMWVLTEDTTTRIKYFREPWGVWQGEIIIK
jgi:hypothetical protein